MLMMQVDNYHSKNNNNRNRKKKKTGMVAIDNSHHVPVLK